jgi:hypothetical protein
VKPADIIKLNYSPSILIYSMAGDGKTGLISQLFGAYCFDFDRGMRTAATLKDKFFDQRQLIEFDEYRDEDPMKPKQYAVARKKLNGFVRDHANGKGIYDAYIVDSLTGLCKAAQLGIQEASHSDPLAKMEIQDWGSLIAEIERFLTLLRSLRVLTVVTAHVDMLDKPAKDGKGKPKVGEREVLALFPMSGTKNHGMNKLMWLFDEVWFADKRPIGQGRIEYRVDGNKAGTYKTRTRSSFGLIQHDEIGMVELLKMIGFEYGQKGT